MAENIDMLYPETTKPKQPIFVFLNDIRSIFKRDVVGMEILGIALPAALAMAADPIASLIDTAFIGHLGPVEIAAVGVAVAIFNQASKVTIFPLVSVTTSLVAEEDTVNRINDERNKNKSHKDMEIKSVVLQNGSTVDKLEKVSAENNAAKVGEPEQQQEEQEGEFKAATSKSFDDLDTEKPKNGRRNIPSASTALALGAVLGLFQAIFLVLLAKPLLNIMGVKSGSPMLSPALKYLTIRSLGAPAVLLSLAMQGIFRGFKDTKTPLYAIVAGDVLNIMLDPIFIFACRLGVSGAAIAHILSQYVICLILLFNLIKEVDLLPPSIKELQLGKFLKNGGLLLARVIATTICVTLAASLAARLGTTQMAGFQVCLQVWLTSSLLADGLAVAGQAILACAFAEKDYKKATAVAARVLQMGFVLGLGLALVVGLGLQLGSGIFSKDKAVIHMITIGIPFVAATQPINSLAFVFDGVNFGASDFAYSAYSMILVSLTSIGILFIMAKTNGFVGIWLALTIFMFFRTFAGIWRMGTRTGPWHYLRGRSSTLDI